MKATKKKKILTLGELVEASYRGWGKRRASGMLRLAALAHLIELPKHRYLAIG